MSSIRAIQKWWRYQNLKIVSATLSNDTMTVKWSDGKEEIFWGFGNTWHYGIPWDGGKKVEWFIVDKLVEVFNYVQAYGNPYPQGKQK